MEEEKKEENTLIVSSDYYSSSYIVNKVYLVTIKRYTTEHSLMIVDTTRADEHITISLLSAIYRNLSRPDTDSLMITSFSQKLNRMDLVEIDTYNLLENNQLQIKIPNIDESKEKEKKENLHSCQPRRNPALTEESVFVPLVCKPVFGSNETKDICVWCDRLQSDGHCPYEKSVKVGGCNYFLGKKNEMSASNNTERR